MPVARVQLPDGRIGRFDVPAGTTPEQVESFIGQQFGNSQSVKSPAPAPSLGRTVFDQGMQGATFALGDEPMDVLGAGIAKYLPESLGGRPDLFKDQSYTDVLKDTRNATKDRLSSEFEARPVTSIASNLAGGLLTGGIGTGTKVGKAADTFIRSGNLPARIVKSAAAGATSGGVYGFGAADDGDRLEGAGKGALAGAAFGAATPVAGAALTGVKNEIQSLLPKSAQSAADLRKAASPLFDRFTKSGGVYSTKLTDEIADIADASRATGVAGQTKKADEALNEALDYYSSLRGKKLSPADLQKLDQSFADDISRFNRAGEYNFGRILNNLKYELRERAFDPNKAANYIESGSPQAVIDLLEGNKLWQQSYKAKDVEKILQKAKGTENPQTSIRTGLKNLLANDKKMAGYSKEDKAILEEALKRGYTGGLVRLFGGRLTDSIAGGAAGLAAGGPVGAIAGAVAGKAVGGGLANAAGGIQANRLRGGLQKIQNSGTGPISGTRTSGIIPALLEGQAAGGITHKSATPTPLPDVQLPQLGIDPELRQPYSPQSSNQSDLLGSIAKAESNGNLHAKAKTSSAEGKYQFIRPTLNRLINKYGNDYGITQANWKQEKNQDTLAFLLAQENVAALEPALGRPPTKGELYIAHFLGPDGAKKLIKAHGTGKSAASLFPNAALANRNIFYQGNQPRSVEEVYALLDKKVS